MLKFVKKQLHELLQTLMGAGEEIKAVIEKSHIGQEYGAGLVNLLADAQEAAAAIGSRVEAECLGEDEGLSEEERHGAEDMIALLEKYCEYLWQITQAQEGQRQLELTLEAWKILEEAEHALKWIPEQMAAVFLPYKASMWDCMESVWQAACEDPDWVPFVMPIPYFDLQDGKVTARHFEGDRFPDYVPVVDYNQFPLKELHPSALFVHNPFDDCNIVTSVLPQYYSGELKKITDCLVYIPYYITGDGVFVTHRYFPSYENMDYIVTQCERTVASFSSGLPAGKFLPFGSPIADRVLRLEKEKPDIPEEWKAQLKNGKDFGNDRVVMLNTSISLLMKQRERFLDKIEYLFALAKQKKGITLVWRPHPLLAASARAMGEQYAARLEALEEKFRNEKIGVLDKNPDVGVTVALCHAYLGETSSSVLHMFGIAGKPRFYINLQIPSVRTRITGEKAGEGDAAGGEKESAAGGKDAAGELSVSAWCRQGNKEYYVLDESGWIVERETGSEKFRPLVRIPGREAVWGRFCRRMEAKDGSLWLYPAKGDGVFVYCPETGSMRKLFEPGRKASEGSMQLPEGSAEGLGEADSTEISEGRKASEGSMQISEGSAEGLGEADSTEISEGRKTSEGSMQMSEGSAEGSGEAATKEVRRESPEEEPGTVYIDEECLSFIRAEKFKRGNPAHVWSENEKNTPDDFFRFLQTAEDRELTGAPGEYNTWLANLDGSCGRKVLQAVKEFVSEV